MSYTTELDIRRRLHESIIMYDGEPWYVASYKRELPYYNLILQCLKNSSTIKEIKCTDPKIDLRTPKLGYFKSSQDRWKYLTRIATRSFKQGLSLRNLAFKSSSSGLRGVSSLVGDGMYNCILGRGYHSLASTLESTEFRSRAISRDFCVVNNGMSKNLEWKAMNIGSLNTSTGKLNLKEKLTKATPVIQAVEKQGIEIA